MKLKTLILILALVCSGTLLAQQHIAESKSLVGLWQHVEVTKNDFGETVSLASGNYKIFNADGTFYTFFILRAERCNPEKDRAHINMYGTYSVTSDSTLTEHVIVNSTVPRFNDTDTEIRYKFASGFNNNAVYMLWNSTANNHWIPEMWERVVLSKKEEEKEKQVL